mmetsp:Transcript_4399/g.8543  ORF Transcript_4399/g.8543 Transcript_4399/m.8543 type:complete len:99 (+) Transcript_4399:71-367(+)
MRNCKSVRRTKIFISFEFEFFSQFMLEKQKQKTKRIMSIFDKVANIVQVTGAANPFIFFINGYAEVRLETSTQHPHVGGLFFFVQGWGSRCILSKSCP